MRRRQARWPRSCFWQPGLREPAAKATKHAKGEWTHLLRRKGFVMRTMKRVKPAPDWITTPDATPDHAS